MSSILIINGEIVTSEKRFQADLLIENEQISQIGNGLKAVDGQTQVIDASGHYIFPGGIDPHVHMQLPSMGTVSADDFLSGTSAAIVGGTTTIIDFVTPSKGESMLDALVARKKEATDSVCDYSFHNTFVEIDEDSSEQLQKCLQEGISSFKIYMAYLDSIGVDKKQIQKIMDLAAKHGALILAHCEDHHIVENKREELASLNKLSPNYHPISRPAQAEAKAIDDLVTMAKASGTDIYVVHTSSKAGVEAIRKGRKDINIWAESCPQYLLLEDSVYLKENFEAAAYVMSPPIRKVEDQQALWQALTDGTIQTIATDHCPFDLSVKKQIWNNDFRKIPNGAAGVENRMALLYTYGVEKGDLSLEQFVQFSSTNAAKIFGLYPQKGEIAVGSDADIVIWNPNQKRKISAKTHKHNCDRNIFEGMETVGAPTSVILRGQLCLEDEKLSIVPGSGRFLKRKRSII